MSISSFTILYGSLFLVSVGVLVHLRFIQANYQSILNALKRKVFQNEEKEKTEFSRTLHLMSKSSSSGRIPKKTRLGRLRDSPTVSILLIAFSMVMSALVTAAIIFSIMVSGIDLASFIIMTGFLFYLYFQGYPYMVMYLRVVRSTEFDKLTDRDLKLIESALTKVRDLQADLIFVGLMLLLLTFYYEMLRDDTVAFISQFVFFLNEKLLFFFHLHVVLGAVFLVGIVLLVSTFVIAFFIKSWQWSRPYRRKLVP